jgi:TPP-dependent pyruvate/acetoin dehydrogenase alpha subunit
VLIECETMRMRGHSEHDAHEYVPRELLEEWAKRDPLELARAYIIGNRIAAAGDLDRIDEEIKKEVDEAAEEAYLSPLPEAETVAEGVYRERGARGEA